MRRRDINGKYISEWRLQSRLGTITKFLEQDLSTRDKIVNQKIITQIFQLQELENRAVPECEIMITFPITSKNLEEKFGFFA